MAQLEPLGSPTWAQSSPALQTPQAPRSPRLLWSIDPLSQPTDPRLVLDYGPERCLQAGVLPWRRLGGVTVVLCDRAEALVSETERLVAHFGPIRLAHADRRAIRRAIELAAAGVMVSAAEVRVARAQSCRGFVPDPARKMTAAAVLGLAILALGLWPTVVLGAASVVVLGTLLLTTGLRLAASFVSARPERPLPALPLAELPVISVLVPLFRETDVASHLLARMNGIDYPRDRLDLCLILEEEDEETAAALSRVALPPWAQVIRVPRGSVRTKPRAMNYALAFARGSIIGIYDAEDIPGADHLRQVAAHFRAAGPQTACLQGKLDYFNPEANWIARCFTLEYAMWFRLILPGLDRLGLVVPLGGTTLFLRREAIEAVGGWDAHNVTEDADLGLRLARWGYRTEVIDIVTLEEANARAWPWIKQRSRWLKGYALTWMVHMRDPVALWRDLGAWRFLGVQLIYFGTLVQFTLAPLMWSFWLVALGVDHPVAGLLSANSLLTVVALFLACEVVALACAAVAARRAGRPRLAWWAVTLQFYFIMAALAMWRGLWEIFTRPFHWDKTMHGHFAPPKRAFTRPPVPLHKASPR